VGWIHTAKYVSWIPLAPGETYYGHGYYGPGSVNIHTLQNRTFAANRNFINRNARNAVRVVHRDTFLHGRQVTVPAKENPFNQRNGEIGPPRFKPDRETHAPVLKKIPVAKQPPQRIRRISTETLRQERKLAPEKSGSVFTPGKPVREMPATLRDTPNRMQRERRPDTYSDGLQKRQEVQPQQNQRQKLEKPVKKTQPVTTITPTTPTRTMKEAAPTSSRQQRQPATSQAAPQPVAPQPIAPRPTWTPAPSRQTEQSVSPIRQQPSRTSVPKVRQTVPVAPQVQRPQARQQQPQKPAQTIKQQQPVAGQPIVNQPSATPQATSPAATPESRQQSGNYGNRPSLLRPEGYRQNR